MATARPSSGSASSTRRGGCLCPSCHRISGQFRQRILVLLGVRLEQPIGDGIGSQPRQGLQQLLGGGGQLVDGHLPGCRNAARVFHVPIMGPFDHFGIPLPPSLATSGDGHRRLLAIDERSRLSHAYRQLSAALNLGLAHLVVLFNCVA